MKFPAAEEMRELSENGKDTRSIELYRVKSDIIRAAKCGSDTTYFSTISREVMKYLISKGYSVDYVQCTRYGMHQVKVSWKKKA